MNKHLRVAITAAIAFGVCAPLSAEVLPLFDDCIACGTETVTDLIAGGGNEKSAMVVGEVIVNNCETAVCVEYVLDKDALDAGWLITETHVEVSDTLGGIPQTKKFNPIPGHFEDVKYFEYGTADYRYCVSFDEIGNGVEAGSEINVAAHAVVTRPLASGEWTQVWQIGDVEQPLEGRLTNYADEFNWGDPAGPTTLGPGLNSEQPSFVSTFIVGSSELGEFPYNSNTAKSYATDFDIEWTGALPWGGELIVSWSPGKSASEEKQVAIDGVGPEIFTATGTNRPGEGWFLDTYPLVEHSMPVGVLGYGDHTINFQHTSGDGTFWDWIRLEQPGLESETAWAAGCSFSGKNWATYICGYVVQECNASCPEITGFNGDVLLLDEPLGSVQGGVTTVEVPQVFAEYAGTDHSGFTLDIDASNATKVPDGFVVDPETPVCSYYVHFDDSNGDSDQGLFYLTFEEPVMGLIVAGTIRGDDLFKGGNTLCDTDVALGNDLTTYPASATCGSNGGSNGDARGLEMNIALNDPTAAGNQDPVEIDGYTVYFDLNIFNLHDSLRIILPAVQR
ncbi:hypothetical protein ACFL33_05415 [Pseudomonadota bacterium]